MEKLELKQIRVFVCVPATGKTYLTAHDNRFIDLDEMKARYKYAQENVSVREIEFLKGNRGPSVRKDANRYIEQQLMYYLNNTDKILLFAPNPQIVDIINENKIPYCLVFHSKDCEEEYRERMRNRGNQENFINAMLDPINEFYKSSIEDTRPAFKIELGKGEFLSDKLYEIFGEKIY